MHSWKYKKLKDEQRKARRRKKVHSSRHHRWSIFSRNKNVIKRAKAKKERNKFLDKIRKTFKRINFRRKV